MVSFKKFLREQQELLEKLMIFGKKAYPPFGNIVIIQGGSGSGKGFQFNKLFGIEGKIFDVDALKSLVIKSKKFSEIIKQETGHTVTEFDLKNPNDVMRIHELIAKVYNVPNKHQQALFGSILTSHVDRKPNLIFDVTMKDITKLESITRNITDLGYDKKNVHLVWVVNDIVVAKKQNKERSRTVPEDILVDTHEGAAITFKKIIDMGDQIKTYLDGDIYISFNKAAADVELKKSDMGGSYIKNANYFKIKEQGKKQLSSKELPDMIVQKIRAYTPKVSGW